MELPLPHNGAAHLSAAGAVVVRVHRAARMDVDRDLPRVHDLRQDGYAATQAARLTGKLASCRDPHTHNSIA